MHMEFGKLAKLEKARVTRVERVYIREQTFEALLEFCGFRHFFCVEGKVISLR